jgi:hypothetical protein
MPLLFSLKVVAAICYCIILLLRFLDVGFPNHQEKGHPENDPLGVGQAET